VRVLSLLSAALVARGAEKTVDLRPHWDASRPLANPHKGWYHHYYDNGLRKYLPRNDEELTTFPGMDHIYLRLAWAYLEPAEGKYNWEVIDKPIAKWTGKGKGLGIAFRITCRETGTDPIEQKFATPLWVKEAGAKGGYYRRYKEPGDPKFPWEPDYSDPIFLAKLEQFIRAFAARYDGKPWLRYVDVGSFGDWGEGHTSSGSGKRYDLDTRMKHMRMHVLYFRKTLLVVSDDLIQSAETEVERDVLHRFAVAHGISYRDDSILVEYWAGKCGKTFSVSRPEYFDAVFRTVPTILETAHLGYVVNKGLWEGRSGTPVARLNATGPDFLRGAIRQMRATYIGYHGYVHEWTALPENPALTHELLNLCGYWYFPHEITFPDTMATGRVHPVTIKWENRGVAPAYHAYQVVFRLRGPEVHTVGLDAGNLKWMPSERGATHSVTYRPKLPVDMVPGEYELAFRLHCPATGRGVLLPFKRTTEDADGFYAVGQVNVAPISDR